MRAINFTVIKITIYVVIGILIAYNFNIGSTISLSISLISFAILSVLYLLNRKATNRTILFGAVTMVTFISLGIATTVFHDQKNQNAHYTNHINTDNDSIFNIVFKVREVLKPGNYYNKYVIDFTSIDDKQLTGKSLLNVQKDSTNTILKVDDIVATKSRIKDLISPLNPHQFDYKAYLKKQHIYHQLFVKSNEVLILDRDKTSIFGFAAKLREIINKKLKEYPFKDDELAIINALLLGQRQDISKDIYNSYTQAGAIHILAVSGLHVGIILLILNLVFKPLDRFKHGKTLKTILIVFLLWCFAIVAGLSASVTRAVTMFSIVAIGMNWKRPTNVYNTLAISIFVLLLIKPMFLFDVGFQLSYLAVFAIVWIQPLLYNIWQPKNWLVDKFWRIFTVTIAAQFGILPVSLYYFHQFPGLFFVSNLVIIPVLGLILGLGLLVIFLAVFDWLPEFLAKTFGFIIGLMNDFVSFISQQEVFLFKHIPFGITLVVTSYLLIIASVKFYQNRTYKHLMATLIAVAVFISSFIFNSYKISKNEFLVFHKSRFSVIGIKQNQHLILHHNLDSLNLDQDKLITNYKIGSWVDAIETDSVQSVYKIKNKLILVVDSLGVYNTSFKPNYVLLRNSPKINLNRLIDALQPEVIIADGSNYKTYQERWQETCLKKEIPFHQTSKKGAFKLSF
jgi:competence protein ComEC